MSKLLMRSGSVVYDGDPSIYWKLYRNNGTQKESYELEITRGDAHMSINYKYHPSASVIANAIEQAEIAMISEGIDDEGNPEEENGHPVTIHLHDDADENYYDLIYCPYLNECNTVWSLVEQLDKLNYKGEVLTMTSVGVYYTSNGKVKCSKEKDGKNYDAAFRLIKTALRMWCATHGKE